VPTGFNVGRLDYTCEARYQQPELGIFRDGAGLSTHIFTALRAHGVTLDDLKIERGDGTLGQLHIFCKLFDFGLTIRTRPDRVDIVGVFVNSQEKADKFSAAAVDALTAIEKLIKGGYSTYTIQVHLHGTVSEGDTRTFLAQFSSKTPNAGPITGNAIAYYYGPAEERLSSGITVDFSLVFPGGLYVRVQGLWDATRVTVQALPVRINTYVQEALTALNLERPSSTAGAK
jgi:hypothetical protein